LVFRNELCNGAAGPRGLLEAVARKAVAEKHVRHVRVPAQNGVLVHGVVFVETRPRALHFQGGKSWAMLVQGRPHDFFEQSMIGAALKSRHLKKSSHQQVRKVSGENCDESSVQR